MANKILPAIVVALAPCVNAPIAAPVADLDSVPSDLKRATLIAELNQLLEDVHQT